MTFVCFLFSLSFYFLSLLKPSPGKVTHLGYLVEIWAFQGLINEMWNTVIGGGQILWFSSRVWRIAAKSKTTETQKPFIKTRFKAVLAYSHNSRDKLGARGGLCWFVNLLGWWKFVWNCDKLVVFHSKSSIGPFLCFKSEPLTYFFGYNVQLAKGIGSQVEVISGSAKLSFASRFYVMWVWCFRITSCSALKFFFPDS